MLEHLLRSKRDPRSVLGRKRERLVERVRVQRLRAAADGRERLHGHADDVELGLLRRERGAARLRVEAERERLRIGRPETVPHDARPQSTRGTELRHLLKKSLCALKKNDTRSPNSSRRKPRVHRRRAIGDAVCERECELLHRGRARFADVVPGDRDRVQVRHSLRAIREEVGRDPHRRPRREM